MTLYRHTVPSLLALALALPALAAGCQDTENSSAAISRVIGSEGGMIETNEGFQLIVPSGALSENVEITVEALEEDPANAAGPAYLLTPEGLTFSVPVQVRLPLDSDMDGHFVLPFTAPGGTDDYTTLQVLEQGPDFILTETTHFSNFVAGTLEPQILKG